MTVSELITTLNRKGVRLWADGGKLRINAPKGTITEALKHDIAEQKSALLEHLQASGSPSDNNQTATGLSLRTIGQLIGSKQDASPVVDVATMAKGLKVTFRPLPTRVTTSEVVLSLRKALETSLKKQGVEIVPWQEATRIFHYSLPVVGPMVSKLPVSKQPAMSVVKSHISAVIDVERPVSRVKSYVAEQLYRLRSKSQGVSTSVAEITQQIGWAEDHAIQRLEDPTATQVILLAELDRAFVDPNLPYADKISLGVDSLVSNFSEIIIGASAEQISILNMNLSDSLFERSQLDRFVARSLIPKIYVPISPLPLSRFQLGHYRPVESPYAQKLADLSRALAKTDLFPSGFKLAEVVRRQSHRDIVSAIVNGRTGVSYGFVAYTEPPRYVGEKEISKTDWQQLSPVEGFAPTEIRQNSAGRRYLKTSVGAKSAGATDSKTVYRQIPDIWLTCSRSGANKTKLDIEKDILRLGVLGNQSGLQLQVAEGVDITAAKVDIKPSYDTYVMVAITLSTALYTPELIEQGAPMIHFHGYPSQDWFEPQEDFAGTENLAVPCGTYESGVFNFLSVHQLAHSLQRPLKLVGLVEPDHGINLVASDLAYLLSRVEEGRARAKIELGGRHLNSLMSPNSAPKALALHGDRPTALSALSGGTAS